MTRPRSRETAIFTGATLVLLVHAVDDAFFHRQPGYGPTP